MQLTNPPTTKGWINMAHCVDTNYSNISQPPRPVMVTQPEKIKHKQNDGTFINKTGMDRFQDYCKA
jgi:hypothetical protein